MLKTVESVTEGHPDKVCDQVSDAILDEFLRRDQQSRVAVEAFGCHGVLIIGGEVTSTAEVDVERVARNLYAQVGYSDEIDVLVHLEKQSPDIAQGVNPGGAGDQGIMYGYASAETPEMMPKAVVLAHALTRRLADLRRHDPLFAWLRPDGKAQVTMDGGRVKTVLVSAQHDSEISQEEIRALLTESVIAPLLGETDNLEVLVNPTGRFVLGGFAADTGLTGRKIMVDTYGGLLPHGGGAFSGKDPTKVDRSASYMARFAAKNLVAGGYAKNVLVSVAYAIGRAEPLMLAAKSGEGKDLSAELRRHFDFRPQAIIERLNLRKPIYRQTASYGHFGRDGFPWEEIVRL
ncbi:methionine adenosyltransferase [Patescibacteria group bacterium]|nr:MAG: methionine adenosyltransferase [Patescibacteria group bacterium]